MNYSKSRLALTLGIFSLLAAQPGHSGEWTTHLTFGTAAVGTSIEKSTGGELNFSSSGTGALGVKASYDVKSPMRGEAGFRYGFEGGASWHKLKATKTDADLGLVTLENTWSASLHGRAGYDFGTLFSYAMLGVGLSDASIGTNGSKPGRLISAGSSIGFGLEAEINQNWSGQIEALAISSPEFTPDGGGGLASTGVGEIRIGLTGRF